MLEIQKIDHVGIRIKDKAISVPFYQSLGFEQISDYGFEQGHPIIMRSASSVVLNLLGPSDDEVPNNILMDIEARHSGYTHIALRVASVDAAEAYFNEQGYPITGRFSFGDLRAIFIRDPDRNVIEFDEYPQDQPGTRNSDNAGSGYQQHP